MKIVTEKLLINVNKLFGLLDDYEQIYNSFYHEIENQKAYWYDSHANYFFSSIVEEKKENIIFFEEFKSIVNLYGFIVDKYKNFGNTLYFDLNNRDIFINNIDNCISDIDNIINNYKDLDSQFFVDENKLLLDERMKYYKIKDKLLYIKEVNKKSVDTIEEIERQIKLKLSKLYIISIKGNEAKNGGFGSVDEMYMDIDNVNIGMEKLKFYSKSEEINYEDVSKILNSIGYFYDTSNKEELENLIAVFLHKFKIIISNHKNNIILLNSNLDSYKEAKNNLLYTVDEILKEKL